MCLWKELLKMNNLVVKCFECFNCHKKYEINDKNLLKKVKRIVLFSRVTTMYNLGNNNTDADTDPSMLHGLALL